MIRDARTIGLNMPSGHDSAEIELSALVICFNGAPKVTRFFPSVASAIESLGVRSEIIFVDDCSTDGTAAAAQAAVPAASVVALDQRRGASGARNAAARAARGRFLLFCDDDIELTADAIRAVWDARDPSHCVIPLVRDLRGDLQNSITARWRWGDLKLVNHATPVTAVAYPDSACMLLSRQLYWRAGGFDERYLPNCYEDVAFGFALTAIGSKAVMVPNATITHHVHGSDPSGLVLRSFEEHLTQKRELIYKNRWLFDLLVLRGWRRWLAVALGLPRTALESLRVRSVGPARGYFLGWKAFLTGRRVMTAGESN